MEKSLHIIGVGTIKSIDTEARDIILTCETPKGKEVDAKVHMWKVQGVNSEDEAHANRPDWATLAVGDEILVRGHMGNNGRIICTGYAIKPNVASSENDGEDEEVLN